jgi:hypothetical protein
MIMHSLSWGVQPATITATSSATVPRLIGETALGFPIGCISAFMSAKISK